MGYLAKDTRQEILVVSTALGKAHSTKGRRWPKVRTWVMADQTAVMVTTGDGKTPLLETIPLVSVEHKPREKKMFLMLADDEIVTIDTAGCGCNMGILSSAPPTTERDYLLQTVRSPDWYQES